MTNNLGSSEFSFGQGLSGNPANGYVPSVYERLRAVHQTDSTNPNASEEAILAGTATRAHVDSDGVYHDGDLSVEATNPVIELPGLPQTGKVDASKYNPGHEPDGLQDGEGREWRASIPPNPIS